MHKDLLYFVPGGKYEKDELVSLLKKHPEIKFVSLVGIDLAGNDTDEKIPMHIFQNNYEDFFDGTAVQTDGSSVVLTGLVSLNNAKLDMVADASVNWFVDYNFEHIDEETGKPVGTLRIPSFLVHAGQRVDSRAILTESIQHVKEELIKIIKENKHNCELGFSAGELDDIVFTVATELEFWVKTPAEKAELQELSASQVMREQYWQRTRGEVRTALEQAILMMEAYGLKPEMGHKEVGGVKARIDSTGHLTHVLEQLEIDWRYSTAVQCADNELQARIIVKEAFRANGLDVTFQAKPIDGVAGSGEHVHVGIAARLKSGKLVNLFAPGDLRADFLSPIGYGALMGILKNYEVINPFISSTNDSFNRLKPGFEAPVCIVASLGHTPELPSRNRTILVALIRDVNNPYATRFEVRSPNPYTNTYVAVAAFYLAMLDGIKAAVASGKTKDELLRELSKKPEEKGFYLEEGRAYRSEHDVFDDYSAEERNSLFGTPPATVWENMENLKKYPEKLAVLQAGNALRKESIKAFADGALIRWHTELLHRIIPENLDMVKSCKCLHSAETSSDHDLYMWNKIQSLRLSLAKDTIAQKSMFTRIKNAVEAKDYDLASSLQIEMAAMVAELRKVYFAYKSNMIHTF